ncbi:PLD-like domain-containing protein [Frankineae bacterium MT45]|nr:PLD-like domain-containing protein [Frankineae bacterium MT45]
MVAGFASIAKIIEFVADSTAPRPRHVRVLLGTEPFATERRAFGSPAESFTKDVRRYWVEERGISLRLSAKIVQTLQALDEQWFEVRFVPGSERLHAKIYIGDHAATVGSSNFTEAGLRRNFEANSRFAAENDPKRFADLKHVAENYWIVGVDWSAEMRDLLEQMLQMVSWQEALARACADLLEGQWAANYFASIGGLTDLWPSQQSGIAEALWVVENVGSVLVADATGSGKTRMGAHLTRAVRDRLWNTGRVRSGLTVLVCPPAVESAWLRESASCGLTIRSVSHGLLSRPGTVIHRVEEDEVAHAQILAIDEAHNFLARRSNRTGRIRDSAADHVLMFTATPINRGGDDLLALVDLLGADNFDDAALAVLDQLARRGHGQSLGEEQKELLRREIQRFTVRRTKKMLNEMVDREPDAYRHPTTGRICRYPSNVPRQYPTQESARDEDIASSIRAITSSLLGLTFLGRNIAVPPARRREFTDEKWLEFRRGSAAGLAAYHVLSTMRSSKAAVLEHVLGTDQACGQLSLDPLAKTQPTGDMLARLTLASDQGPPIVELDCELPSWLVDVEQWRAACLAEYSRYRQIADLAGGLSQAREQAKAKLIADLARQHDRILAFDHHPITLAVIGPLVAVANVPVVIATGGAGQERKRVRSYFAPTSSEPAIALCSDAMNEGLNLQGASVVVHFDMPTTLRVAEQRVGRVDRMDTPYDSIEVMWPADGPAFATRADELLQARNAESAELLGSNLPIPQAGGDFVDMEAILDEAVNEYRPWDGLHDALDPVRRLVQGEDALIPQGVYRDCRSDAHRVLARLSPVQSETAWAFFAIRGTLNGAPRWMLIESQPKAVISGLDDVVDSLRVKLQHNPTGIPFSEECVGPLSMFLDWAAQYEIALLPRRFQRALAQMSRMCHEWSEASFGAAAYDVAQTWASLGKLAEPPTGAASVDLYQVAELWLTLVQPRRQTFRAANPRRRYSRLVDIDPDLRRDPLPLAQVVEVMTNARSIEPLDQRISACILGVAAGR